MTTLGDLLALAGASLPAVVTVTGADPAHRTPVTGYESLTGVDAIDAPNDVRIFVRGEKVKLIYLDEAALPPGVGHETLVAAVGSEGKPLRSRQAKSAVLHVVADRGVAWSEDGGEVGFVEVFPPMTMKKYRARVYHDPGPFIL